MAPRAAWVKTRRGHYFLPARFSGNLKVHAARSCCGNVSNRRSQPWEATKTETEDSIRQRSDLWVALVVVVLHDHRTLKVPPLELAGSVRRNYLLTNNTTGINILV